MSFSLSYAERHQLDRRQHLQRYATATESTPPPSGSLRRRATTPPASRKSHAAGVVQQAALAASSLRKTSEFGGTSSIVRDRDSSPLSGNTAIAEDPECWMCSRRCAAYGWTQIQSTDVVRISFYPASGYTLCGTCAKGLAPTHPSSFRSDTTGSSTSSTFVEMVERCNPSRATHSHSAAYVAFLVAYRSLLEQAFVRWTEDEGGTTRRTVGTPTSRELHRRISPATLAALHRAVSSWMRDRDRLTLKEAHMLMRETGSVQAFVESLPPGLQAAFAREASLLESLNDKVTRPPATPIMIPGPDLSVSSTPWVQSFSVHGASPRSTAPANTANQRHRHPLLDGGIDLAPQTPRNERPTICIDGVTYVREDSFRAPKSHGDTAPVMDTSIGGDRVAELEHRNGQLLEAETVLQRENAELARRCSVLMTKAATSNDAYAWTQLLRMSSHRLRTIAELGSELSVEKAVLFSDAALEVTRQVAVACCAFRRELEELDDRREGLERREQAVRLLQQQQTGEGAALRRIPGGPAILFPWEIP